jgi:hypothetical protein
MGILIALLASALAVHSGSAQTKLPDGVLLYWNCDGWEGSGWRDNDWAKGGSGRIHFDGAEKKHGKASLRIEGAPDAPASALSLERPAEVETGQEYVLRVWTKTAGVTGSAQVRALAHGPQPGEQYRPLGWVRLSDKTHLVLPADQDWTAWEVPIAELPGGTTRVFFYLYLEGEGTVWFDEFFFAEAGTEVPLGGEVQLKDEDYAGIRLDDADLPENLLVNGGFEEGMQGWQKMPADYSAEIDTTVSHTGKGVDRLSSVADGRYRPAPPLPNLAVGEDRGPGGLLLHALAPAQSAQRPDRLARGQPCQRTPLRHWDDERLGGTRADHPVRT